VFKKNITKKEIVVYRNHKLMVKCKLLLIRNQSIIMFYGYGNAANWTIIIILEAKINIR